jgi:pyruvate/2-oxoglutarate dehydrogenase complex dihydrolipoamide dehydrogenase (E3) component
MSRSTADADVIVIGSGSGGGVAAQEIATGGRTVILIEAGRVGGECHYVACVPSKALLIAAREGVSWANAVLRRDEAADGRSDVAQTRDYEKAGIRIVRGSARLLGERDVSVDLASGEREDLRWGEALVLAPGSEPVIPSLPGLRPEAVWTSDQALSSNVLPTKLLVLGGGAVGCELAQVYASFGTVVTLIENSDRLLVAEQPWVGQMIGDALVALGVDLRTCVEAVRMEPHGGGSVVDLSDGSQWSGDRVLLATGRRPRTDSLGLEALGVSPGEKGELRVDARCHVLTETGRLANVYAVGDVTATAPFTHTANAQARTVAAELDGLGRDVQVHASPRAVYTEPTVWCVGQTEAEARDAGLRPKTASVDLDKVERGELEGVHGRFEMIVDERGTVIGAAAVGPAADGWATAAQIAVQQRLNVNVLGDALFAFPTLAETVGLVARELATADQRGEA